MRSKNSRNSHTNLPNKENFGQEIIIGATTFVHLTPEYQRAKVCLMLPLPVTVSSRQEGPLLRQWRTEYPKTVTVILSTTREIV